MPTENNKGFKGQHYFASGRNGACIPALNTSNPGGVASVLVLHIKPNPVPAIRTIVGSASSFEPFVPLGMVCEIEVVFFVEEEGVHEI